MSKKAFYRSNTLMKTRMHSSSVTTKQPRFSLSSMYDAKINTLSAQIQKNQGDMAKDNALFEGEGSMDVIVYVLNKPNRNQTELFILKVFLKTLKNFTSLMSSMTIDIDSLLMNVAFYLKCERMKKGNAVFKYGDKGNKYYVILRGSASVLLPKETKVSLSLFDYIKMIIRLVIVRENELLVRTVNSNKGAYNISVEEIKKFVKKGLKDDDIDMDSNGVDIGQSVLDSFDNYDKNKFYVHMNKISEMYKTFKARNKKGANTVEEYIALSFPSDMKEIVTELHVETKELILYSYYEVVQLNKGDAFGEIALTSSTAKRTATIICDEETVFGTLQRDAYNSCIRDIQSKIRRGNVKFLLGVKIFSHLNWNFFESRIFNFFKQIKTVSKEIVVQQGKICDYIFFVKKGEYEVTTYMNDEDITYFATAIKKKIRNANLKLEDDAILSKINDSNKGNLIKKKNLKIAIMNDNDVIGLDDMLINNKSVFTVQCLSESGTLFSIERTIFFSIASKIQEVANETVNYTITRINVMLNRLSSLSSVNATKDLTRNQINTSNKNVLKMKTNLRSISAFGRHRPTPSAVIPIQHNPILSNYMKYQSISEMLLDDSDTLTKNSKNRCKTSSLISNTTTTFNNNQSTDGILKRIIGVNYSKRKSKKFESIIVQSHKKNNVFVDILKLDSANKEPISNRYGNVKYYLKNYYLSPSKIPSNFYDKAKPLSIRLNKL